MIPSTQVIPVPMHHVSHFEYLSRREAIETVAKFLDHPDQTVVDNSLNNDEEGTENLPIKMA